MNERQILPVIIIDFLSADRTFQFIRDFNKITSEYVFKYFIVDNAGETSNRSKLLQGMKIRKISEFQDGSVYCNSSETIFVIEPGKNLGFAKGNNCGFRLANLVCHPKYVLFSNSDILLDETFDIDLLIHKMRKDTRIGVVGPKVTGLDGKPQSPCRELTLYQRWWKKLLLWPLDRMIYKVTLHSVIPSDLIANGAEGTVYRVIGAFMLCDADKFVQSGQFDENTFLYAEELILAERMKANGYCTYYEPKVSLIHEGGYTTKKQLVPLKKLKQRLQSELYYYHRYKGVPMFAIGLTRVLFAMYEVKVKLLKR